MNIIKLHGYSVIANPTIAIKHYTFAEGGWLDCEDEDHVIKHSLDAVIIAFKHNPNLESKVYCFNINEEAEATGLLDVMCFNISTHYLQAIERKLLRHAYRNHDPNTVFIEAMELVQAVRFVSDSARYPTTFPLTADYSHLVELAKTWLIYNSKVVL